MKRVLKRESERGGIIVNLVVLLFLVVLCVLLYFARHPIMRYAAEEWIIDEPAAHADAIVVLSDDNYYGDRATHASELFRQGVAPQVVASGRKLRLDAGIGELIAHDLIERGVPKEKIIVYDQESDSTREEAQEVAKLAVARHWKSLVIVTSNYHTRRARYIYEKVLPADVSVSVAGARDGDFDPQHWWEKRRSFKIFARELAGMAVAIWELRNVHPSETKDDSKASQVIPAFPNGTILHSAVGNPVQKSRLSLYIFVSAVLS
jgi:uncharacterized SAM-binding protein YcdF (DUF218 family)